MEFLSLRQKQRAWSGSHTVNAKANHSGYTPQNWWAHYKGCALCSLASHQSLNQQAEKENWVWYALSSRRREGLWRFNVADLPSQPSSISNSWLPSLWWAVMADMGRTPWPRNAWHTELCITLADPLWPNSQTSPQLPAPKRLHHHSLVQTTPSIFWPATEGCITISLQIPGIQGVVSKKLAQWESCHFPCSLTQERIFCFHL